MYISRLYSVQTKAKVFFWKLIQELQVQFLWQKNSMSYLI